MVEPPSLSPAVSPACPVSRFTALVVLAGFVWATYATLLGFVFGRRFQEDHTQAFLWAFGSALALVALAELSDGC